MQYLSFLDDANNRPETRLDCKGLRDHLQVDLLASFPSMGIQARCCAGPRGGLPSAIAIMTAASSPRAGLNTQRSHGWAVERDRGNGRPPAARTSRATRRSLTRGA